MPPGSLMMLSDHINLSGANPLIGERTDARFQPMTDAHDAGLRAALSRRRPGRGPARRRLLLVFGPQFRDPAEIRMTRVIGGDAVGMSTVPRDHPWPVLRPALRRHFGHHQYGRGMSDESLSHEHTKAMAPIGAAKLEKVLRRFLRDQG